MYSLTIRDFLTISHSLKGEVFGQAQLLHLNQYEIEVEYTTAQLTPDNIVVDFALSAQTLQQQVAKLNFKNLDDVPELAGQVTTTEFLCKYFHDALAAQVKGEFRGRLKVTFREGPLAAAAYEAEVE